MGFGSLITGYMEDARRIETTAAMAEQAAAQFESIGGPNGAFWAKSLRTNPNAAFAMAQQYGGLGAIEASERAAVGAGRASQSMAQAAHGQGLNPLDFRVLQQYGPEGLKQYRESQAQDDRNIIEGADGFKYYEDTKQRVLPGVQRSAEDRKTLNDASGRPRYTDNGALVFPQAEVPAEERWDGKRLDGLRKERQADLGGITEQINQWKRYEKLDLSNPVSDIGLVQIFGKMLDPNSVVREAEADQIGLAGATTAGQVALRLERMVNAGGVLPEEAKQYLARGIEDVMKGNAANFVQRFDGWRSFNRRNGFDDRADAESLPFVDEYGFFKDMLKEPESTEDFGVLTPEIFSQATQYLSRAMGVSVDDLSDEDVADFIRAMNIGER